MLSYLAGRIGFTAAMVVVLLVATFLMVRLVPGDPSIAAAGLRATADERAEARERLGLDEPVLGQLVSYVGDAARLDLGTSFRSGLPVSDLITDRLPTTLTIALCALALTLIVSIPLGVLIAVLTQDGRRRWLERTFTWSTGTSGAVPEYVAATILVFIFSVSLAVLPVAGGSGPSSYVLPVLALSVAPTALLLRMVRAEAESGLKQDFMRTAAAKRLGWSRVYLRHLLPNVLTGTLTVSGIILAGLVGGAIVVENVFAMPGVGSALIEAVRQNDYPVIQGVILVVGLTVALTNAAVDALLALVNPRLRAR